MKRSVVWTLVALSCMQVAVAAADVKIGYIDSEALRDKLPAFKEAQVQLERLRQQYESEVTDRQSRLAKLEEDFRKQELLMSEARRAELKKQVDDQVKQLQEFTQKTFGPGGELMQKNAELSAPIFQRINTVLQAIAKEDGYDFLFDAAAPNSALVYANEKYDVTEKVLLRLKEEEKDKGKKQEAGN